MGSLKRIWLETPDAIRKRWAGFWSLMVIGFFAATFLIAWRSRDVEPAIPDPNFPSFEGQAVFALGVLPLLGVGWLLTNRATANLYGWLWLLLSVLVGAQQFVQVLASHFLGRVPDLAIVVGGPDGYLRGSGQEFRVVQWLGVAGDYLWVTGIVALAFILLLFPDGRLPSQGWRWVAYVIGCSWATMTLFGFLGGGTSGTVPVERPGGLLGSAAADVFATIFDLVLVTVLLLGVGVAALSVIVRFRRAYGVERQQIKWVMLAGFFFVPTIFWDAPGIWDPIIETTVSAAVPVAVAVAVTRYRLYDIDRILSRTVAYGLVVGLLAAAYFAGIFLMQKLLPQQGDLVVAATTLGVAALFNPVRVRVLTGVERRFNRARYNAEQVVNGFTDRLRNSVDIDLVASDIEAIVGRVLQPNRLSLWIRG
jgi:hypothetical protein